MAGAFNYKPKFVDIRVRPPKPEEAQREADVHQLKPGQRKCEWPGCCVAASAKAPKSRELMQEHYWFCQPHAGEYNKSWDFFAGMTEADIQQFQAARAAGERPTWQFKASRFSREAAAFAAKMGTGNAKGAGAYADPLGLFGASRRRAEAEGEARSRRLGKLERAALSELDLEGGADGSAIRTRYLEMVKRFHPDTNGGDRSAEQKLTRVIKAYKTLQAAKLV